MQREFEETGARMVSLGQMYEELDSYKAVFDDSYEPVRHQLLVPNTVNILNGLTAEGARDAIA